MQRPSRALLCLILFLPSLLPACSPEPATAGIRVITHPDGPLYVGDLVSLEVLLPDSLTTADQDVEVSSGDQSLGTFAFGPYGISGRQQATMWWIWDTAGLPVGDQSLVFTLHPSGTSWEEIIPLEPAGRLPAPEPEAHWEVTSTACCTFFYITGTAAARDIATLTQTAQAEAERAASELDAVPEQPLSVVLVPRVIGHGGFAWGAVYVSYLDDNYIGNEMSILFHHEFVHYYDALVGGTYLPAIFQEGLAVYLSGGHFKPEPLAARAAELLDLDWYIPIENLANDFYTQQHDIGYLEAGALVEYLVDTRGWEAFNEFYRNIPLPENNGEAAVIEAALEEQFGLSFSELESSFRSHLASQTRLPGMRIDLELTVEFFNTVRRYQSGFDPSAYFLTAWLPDGMEMYQRGIVADFLRRPRRLENRLLEWMLIHSRQELVQAEYAPAGTSLAWTNRLLDLLFP